MHPQNFDYINTFLAHCIFYCSLLARSVALIVLLALCTFALLVLCMRTHMLELVLFDPDSVVLCLSLCSPLMPAMSNKWRLFGSL